MPTGLYKRGRRWWFRTDPITKRPASSGCTDKKAAIAEYQRRERVASGAISPTVDSIATWGERVLESKGRHRSENTRLMYEQKLKQICRVLGSHTPVTNITPALVDKYVQYRQGEGIGNVSIDKELGAIRQLCKAAARAGQFVGDVTALKPPEFSRNYKPRTRFLAEAELGALLSVLAPHRAAHVAFIVATGARWGESLRARAADVKPKTVVIRGTKTQAAAREVPRLERMASLLETALPYLPFEPWDNAVRDLATACKNAGIDKVSPNDLRRTTASWLIESGVEAGLVARILGHTTSRMVEMVYGRTRPEKLAELVAAQMTNAKTLHATSDGSSSDDETSIKDGANNQNRTGDLRFTNPHLKFLDWRQCVEIPGITEESADDASLENPDSPCLARRLVHKNVTILEPVAPGAGVASKLVTATNLALTNDPANREELLTLLREAALDLGLDKGAA